MIYLDTSAAMKLVRHESHSAALVSWLADHPDLITVSSILLEIELLRATRRNAREHLSRAAATVRGIATIALTSDVVHRATRYEAADLRSLDAIHLATAEYVVAATGRPLTALLAYDERLLEAGRTVGLRVEAPGVL